MDLEEAAGVLAEEFSRMAPGYESSVARYHAPFVQRVLDAANPRPGERVLDIGCGAGDLTLEAARRVGIPGCVVGIDVAEGMIAVAQSRAAAAGVGNAVFRVMDVRRVAYPEASFDTAVSCLGLPFFDWGSCFRQVHRVLRAGGRFAFVEWTGKGTPTGRAFFEILERFRSAQRPPGVERIREARRVLRESPMAQAGDPKTVRPLIEEAGFEVVRCAPETLTRVFPSIDSYIGYMAAFGDVGQELTAMSSDARAAFRRELAARVASSFNVSELIVSSEVLVCVAGR
ncbi:MAG TPA: methyltransferase domain-containing protein [Thermoplasmata archaeon]|nr:methyltransferase domain-containing protein [Thermoplasmata archaeon]